MIRRLAPLCFPAFLLLSGPALAGKDGVIIFAPPRLKRSKAHRPTLRGFLRPLPREGNMAAASSKRC